MAIEPPDGNLDLDRGRRRPPADAVCFDQRGDDGNEDLPTQRVIAYPFSRQFATDALGILPHARRTT
ncbi:MAG TPA: hypothetical protein VMU33_03310 [Burkholderiaceae bacterium]|nr:hypothetical protein [Burkholderiaceae bacterium]